MAAPDGRHVTACTLDCPDACSLSVEVRDGRLVDVDAAPGNRMTDGWICRKVRRHADRVHGPDRVDGPLLRDGPKGSGRFRSAGWDEALDLVADRIRAAVEGPGADQVVPYLYSSSAPALQRGALTDRLFDQLGAARVLPTICAASTSMAWASTYPGLPAADPNDLPDARFVLVWGANPSVSNTHLGPLVNRARAAGARLAVVDPRRTGFARRADRHLAVRPGTDVVAALAMAEHVEREGLVDREFCDRWVEGLDEYLDSARRWPAERAAGICGVDAAELRELAEEYATTRPAMLRPGWGLERNRNGLTACRAVYSLAALCGQFGRRGSGILVSTHGDAVSIERRPSARGGRRNLNMNHIGALLTGHDGPAPAVLFVQGANPAVTAPDQRTMLEGLAREDVFTVVHDQVMTDTAVLADVVLPAPTSFETDDVAGSYGSWATVPVRAVIDRVGQARTNNEVAAGLAARLGLDPADFDADPSRLLASSLRGDVSLADVERGDFEDPALRGSVQFQDTFPSGPVRLRAADWLEPLPGGPLALLTPATAHTVNSIFGETDPPEPSVRMAPGDAAERGIADGDEVLVGDGRTELRTLARLDAGLRPGVVTMPKGLWRRSLPDGLTANAFAPAVVAAESGGACFNDARVEVTRAP